MITQPIVTHKGEPPMKQGRYFVRNKHSKKWSTKPISIFEGQLRPDWFDHCMEYQGPLVLQRGIFGDEHEPGALVPTITEKGERGLTIELDDKEAKL